MSEFNRRILIVDDEAETLRGYREFLTVKAGSARKSSRSAPRAPLAKNSAVSEAYEILAASTGEAAVELVKAERAAGRRVAAGFFDVKLGAGMDGLATIQAIRQLDPEIHCVVVTAYHDRTVEEIQNLFGDDFKDQWDYLNKPFTQGEIVQKARQMVAAWNRKRQIEAMTAQLVRSERLSAVGQIARGVGHEFGNILLRIMGKTDLALSEDDPVKVKQHLEVVLKASERAGVIVRNLQSFSRSEPSYQISSLGESIDEAVSLISHEFAKNSVKIEKSYRSDQKVRIDKVGMGQVFLNLLINAIHAMPKGGLIKVTVEAASGAGPENVDVPGSVIRVADTGIGIPAEVLPRIFEFAYTTKGDRGSGLGLSISREIVSAHGGTIEVRTELGKGTEFSIWLPLGAPKSEERS